MPLLTMALLLAASFALGALPLTRWAVRLLGGKDLRRLGTGNAGVSAAFIHGGKWAGIAAVLAEIARGIVPVLAGRFWFPDAPAIAIALLIPLVAARYAIARGGGVTNAVWGLLAFSPPVAVSSGISGLLVWALARRWWVRGDRARLFASRCGCLCTPIWVWVWRQSLPEFLTAAGLGVLLTAINLSQGDDMALSKSEQLFSLDDSLDVAICGDKAAKLSQLKRAGFNVPVGFVLPSQEEGTSAASNVRDVADRRKREEGSSAADFVTDVADRRKREEGSSAADFVTDVADRRKKKEGSSAADFVTDVADRRKKKEGSSAADFVADLTDVKNQKIGRGNKENPDRLSSSNSVIQNLKAKIPNRMIVRSSAAGEDGDISSAAGQYQTIGPVFTEAELLDGINRCRLSYWTSEAVAYRRQRQLPDTQMAVLIQPYIEGKIAGVMFSRNPLDGASQIIIEALPGGAESVVGGQVTPVHLEIDFSTIETLEQTFSQLEISSIIDKQIIAELVKQTQAIEAFFHGIPQDIEWSWDGEKVWILQSRPITNLQPFWTRTIAAEVIPGAIRPLTWSINRPLTCGVWGEIFQVVLGDRASNLNFNETATLLGSHAYFNATLLGEIFRMMGLPEQGLEFLLRGQKMGKPPLGKILPNLPGLWRLVQRERALNAEFEVDRTSIFLPALQSLEKSVGSWQLAVGSRQLTVDSSNNAQLPIRNYQYLSELLDKSEKIQEWLKPITYYNILGPIGLAIRKAIFQVDDEWLDNDTAPEIASVRALQQLAEKLRTTAISQFGETVSTAQLAQFFAETPVLQADFEQWLNTYGYLSEVGTDIAVLTWREQPEIYRKLLLTLAQKAAVANLAATGKLSLTFAQKWRLNKCQERATVKSQISEVYARLLAHLRWTFLEIEACGLEMQVFEEPGDIFYLEFGEIQQWIRSAANVCFQDTISQRRDRLLADRDRQIPPVVYGNLLPNSQKRSIDSAIPASAIVRGIPASIGCVEGFVKICHSVTTELGESAIVVVPYTDAGWAPLLLGATAIVAEVGGQLSHGAIIAREYKIPAVMNVAEATTRFRDGQKVRVDGYLGTVELLE